MFRNEAFVHFRTLLQNRLRYFTIHYANAELSVLFYGRCQLLGQKKESTWTPVEKMLIMENWSTQRKYSPTVTLSAIKLKWTGLG